MKKYFLAFILSSVFAVTTIGASFTVRNANAQSSSRPYVVLVNGNNDCCAWDMDTALQGLKGAEFTRVPWNTFRNGANQASGNSNDKAFLDEAANFINNRLDPNRPLIMIGHSFGGDSLLSLAPRIKRRIQFLGVIDPTAAGGLRKPVTGRGVPSNVDYFFNRWQQNGVDNVDIVNLREKLGIGGGAAKNIVPFDSRLVNGSIAKCRAKNCDQQEQSLARKEDGSENRVSCSAREASCTGWRLPGCNFRGCWKGSNGTKAKRLAHNRMPYDEYIRSQITARTKQIIANYKPPSTTPTASKPVQNVFGAIARDKKTERLGWAWGYSSQSEAEKGAIQSCKDSDCKTVTWVKNGYAAIAYGDDLSLGGNWGKSQEEASQKALQSCKQVAQNPQSCTIVKVLESTKGIIVNNPIPTKKPTIAALDPQWNSSIFTYEDKRYGGQARYELKKTDNGIIALHKNGKGDSYTYSLVEGKPDYVIVSSVISPTDNYYIKLYKNGNAEWTAGKTMSANGWYSWGPGQWLDAGSSENNACVTVDSKKGWQKFNLGSTFTKVASVNGGWSVDTRNYSPVGAVGHTGSDAESLAPYNQYKFDQGFPFGALLMASENETLYIQDSNSLSSAPFGAVDMRINDADNALGDNGGSLKVCFGK